MTDDSPTDEGSADVTDVTDVAAVADDDAADAADGDVADGAGDAEESADAGGGAADPATDPLVGVAREAYGDAYVPYSEYPVGAALRTADGTVFSGCNIENANYSNSLHAEEVALASAVQQGHTEFDRIAVASAARDGVTPCGMCRQTLAEFCDGDLEVVCDEGDGVSTYTLGELLPAAISPETLEEAERRRGGTEADAGEAADGTTDDEATDDERADGGATDG